MSTPLDLDRDWKTLTSYLPANYEQLAETHKQLNSNPSTTDV